MSKIEKEVRIISPKDTAAIKALGRNEIAFPDIPFKDKELSIIKEPTLKGAYSTISGRVDKKYLSELGNEWKKKGVFDWENPMPMVNQLEEYILKCIADFDSNEDVDLTKIFIYIQLWGGSSGRYIFVKGGGYEENFDESIYRDAVNAIRNGNIPEAQVLLLKLKYMGISFVTKHIYFWSNKKLPIFDNIISNIVFGRKADEKNYHRYIAALKKLSDLKGVDSHQIERSLFNWANTEEGKSWVELRK